MNCSRRRTAPAATAAADRIGKMGARIMSSNTDFVLAIEDLTVSFDGFKAVDSLNLYVDKNELRVIIGPNGAGKTTVLDLICGKTRPTSGASSSTTRS
jgi:ABC-type uncharacterized transport system ATPase subunit